MVKSPSLERRLTKWNFSYNVYTDLFQVYDRRVLALPNEKLKNKKFDDLTLLYDKSSKDLLLIEVSNAYQLLGDIENMPKKDIIQSIMQYMEAHD
jgi:hypothetical protein